jgi:PII-like signaling protein
MREILSLLRDQHGIHAVTVFRGIAGFGASGEVHAADLLRLTVDLPLVIEFFDEPKIVEAALDLLKELVPSDRIISWRAERRD